MHVRSVRWRKLALVAAALAVPVGCAPAAPPAPVPTPADVYAPHRVYDSRAARWIGFDEMLDRLADADAVFVGEQHDDPGTHRLELALLEGLARRRDRVMIGLEMFERDTQPLLDRYLAGGVAEAEFVSGARAWPNYATDYRPLVEFARSRGWPVVATSVPRPLAARVAREGVGAMDALPPAERALAAAEIRCPRDAYYERFVRTMGAHPGSGHGSGATGSADATAMIDRFYAAQCVKDETMAESVAATLRRTEPAALLVHFNGGFHSDFRLGIVPRVERRRPDARVVTVTAIPVPDLSTVKVGDYAGRADFLLFTRAPEQRSPGAVPR